MRLTEVHVREFKSIRNSNPFKIEDVTCLVGKNEAGKTALLEAIYHLNPIIPDQNQFNVTNDYPRSEVEDYLQDMESGRRESDQIVVRATFKLTDEECAPAEEKYGRGLIRSRSVVISRGYDNTTDVELDIDEVVAVKTLVNGAQLTDDLHGPAVETGTIANLAHFLASSANEKAKALAAAQAMADAMEDPQEKAAALDEAKLLIESQSAKQLRAIIDPLTKKRFSLYIWSTFFAQNLPLFFYFDEYYQMEGQVNIQKLKERQKNGTLLDSDRPMLGLIELARLDLDQILNATNTQEIFNKIDGVSNHLSRQVLKYWSQNKHIFVPFDVRPALREDPEGMRDGMNLWGQVYDSAHRATVRLGTRSRGFIWFFSFLAWFSQQRKQNRPMVLLLDEPGLFLHASAQGDLLRYIEQELKPHHQVIFTTHSPFMVDPLKFDRVRIVRDRSMESDQELPRDQQGSKVFTDVLEADEESLFPLQGALGYDIAQTLFIGPNSLIVEGVSDLLYLQAISNILQDKGRAGLNSGWTITPVGGSDKVPTFVALLGSQKKLNVATLIDLQTKDEQQIENLYKKKLLQKRNVRTFAEFVQKNEADIEDMFDPHFYLELVNSEYAQQLHKPISFADLNSQHPRILVRIENYLKQDPLKSGGFNHYRPARYFAENAGMLACKLDEETVDRFERAFKALNSLL